MPPKDLAEEGNRVVENDLIQGDKVLGNKTVNHYGASKDKVQFEDLEQSNFEDYPAPNFSDDVGERIQQYKFVILGGNYNFDKNTFLDFMASEINQSNQQIKKCTQLSDYYHDLHSYLNNGNEDQILLMYDLHPSKIEFKFKNLKDTVLKSGNTVLISTNEAYESWNFPSDIKNTHWYEIPEENLYTSWALLNYLKKGKEKLNYRLDMDEAIYVDRFLTTDQIDAFIQELRFFKEAPNGETIERLIKRSTEYRLDNINQWFNTLQEKQKLLVIALTLLEGCTENQFFEILDQIIEEVWKKRNQEIDLMDYADMIPLSTFFNFHGRIGAKYPGQRIKIIEIAWKSHKRYILSALPVLTNLVFETLNVKAKNWHLFGTKANRERLRMVVMNTFSDIGLHSFHDIEGEFLKLATSRAVLPQLVVAEAMAKWKIGGAVQNVYQVLRRWKDDDEIYGMIKSIAEEDSIKSQQSLANTVVPSTIALTVGYLTSFDKPGELDKEALEMILAMIDERNGLIVDRMEFAFQKITTRHFSELKNILRNEVLKHPRFAFPVGLGIAKFYDNGFTNSTKDILEEWLRFCYQENEGRQDFETVEYHDIITHAIITAIQYIDYSNDEDKTIDLEWAYNTLEELRREMHQVEIRGFLLDAIVHLIELNFATSSDLTVNFISNIDQEEREQMVKNFRSKYLSERRGIVGGDYRVKIGNYTYASWEDPLQRPRTKVELFLAIWKKSSDVLSQIALKSFVEFDRFEAREQRMIKNYLEEKNRINDLMEDYEDAKEDIVYYGKIEPTAETKAFVKICTRFVQKDQITLLTNISTIILQEQLKATEAKNLLLRLDDDPTDEDHSTVDNIYYVFSLFRNKEYQKLKNPILPGLRTYFFMILAYIFVGRKRLSRSLTPYLFSTSELKFSELRLLLRKLKPSVNIIVDIIFWALKYPVYSMIVVALIILLKKYLENQNGG